MKNNSCFLIYITLLFASSCNKEVNNTQPTELPILNIQCNAIIPFDKKIQMELEYIMGNEINNYEASIERRGGFSNSFPKHSYEIDLKEDVSLGKLTEDDDWILNANYIDKTFLRHVVSYELFMEMNKNNVAAQNTFIELELNGLYNGLYVLMEKLDKSSLKVNEADSEAMIFKEPHIFNSNYKGILPQDSNNFHQQIFPKIELDDKFTFIEEVRDFIINSSPDIFSEKIIEKFDLENLIDWHLLLLLSNNGDGILKNFYLYKVDSYTPIRISPWDYDHSFGRDGDNELNLDERPLNIERSILFARLLKFDWYKKALKSKWIEHNDSNKLSVVGLKKKIKDKQTYIKPFVKKNFEQWDLSNSIYFDTNNFDEEINIMLQFIEIRHTRLVEYFDTF